MLSLTRTLQSFFVEMGQRPDEVPESIEHYMEHLLHLLETDDEEDIIDYYGLFGSERLSLHEIAARRAVADEAMMERIDKNVRRLTVTPEWQSLIQPFTKQ